MSLKSHLVPIAALPKGYPAGWPDPFRPANI